MPVSSGEALEFRTRYGVSQEKFVLLVQAFTADRLKAEGLKIVFRAIALLKERRPGITLLVTREAKYSEELKRAAQDLGVDSNVIFTGDVENPFVPLAICDVFLFPWLGKSGLGLALLEAMSAGKASLIFNTGAESEAIEDGVHGLIVDPDPENIADAIERLMQNPDVRRLFGNNAKSRADTIFTWDNSARMFWSLYIK
jgi:glycosyltransferase involved in cell wall biosynthesis